MSHFRILIVDDDKDSSELIDFMLRHDDASYVITSVATSEGALELISVQSFDLFILDYWLPGITGLDLCRSIRRTDERTPVMFYSAMARESDRNEGKAAGANEYLTKPNDLDKLTGTVARLLNENNLTGNFPLIPKSKNSLW